MISRVTRWSSLWLAFALLPALAGAEIRYRVTPSASGDRLVVEMEFPVSTPTVELQMPSWSPGLYALENYGKNLRDVSATDEAGSAVPLSHPREDTWSLASAGRKRLRVRYERLVSERGGLFGGDEKAVHYGGPTTYLYVVGRKAEPCRLELVVPDNWKIAVSLRARRSRGTGHIFEAKDYDTLADCPVTMGDYLEERYRERGREHLLAFRGTARDKIDRQKVRRMCQFVTQITTDFFHGAPYDRYVWHFWVNEGGDGGAGVEHADSVQMFLSSGAGPRALSLIAHEFIHLWNVKRIRSKVLGPFDYTRLPQTGALWWLEGVTDYYARLLPYRYGAWGRDRFLADALRQVNAVRQEPARLKVSPYESSYRIPEATTSFSSGYQINYYSTGWVLGILFDLELRVRSKGKYSLDDVTRALWDQCKDDQPGFEEDEIRRQLIRFGGESIGELYDQWVLKPGELPIEQQLAKVGLQIVEPAAGTNGKPGVIEERPDITPTQKRLMAGWLKTHKPAHALE